MKFAAPFLTAVTSAFFVGGGSAFSPRVVHESRRSLPHGLAAVRRANPDVVLPFRVGLAQSNLETLDAYLMDVSHPESPNYGKHWNAGKIAQTFRPSKESVDTVRAWLVDGGIDAQRVKLSGSGGWLVANVTIAEAESLLGTEYYVYQYEDDVKEHIGCHEKYHLPEHVSKHVEIVTPTLHFDKTMRSKRTTKKRTDSVKNMGKPGASAIFPKTTGIVKTIWTELADCDLQIVPDCLRALYQYVYEPIAPEKNSYGIAEYTPQALVYSDLDLFFTNYSAGQVGERPIVQGIDGGYIQTTYAGFDYNGESNLDFQYSMSLVGKNQQLTLYQVGDDVEGGSYNNLLDALDGSYCTYEGGDDPDFDGIYPDPYGGGYEGQEDCGTIKPAYVISTSYGGPEADYTTAYMERQCYEYGKLGLMGVTILYASGDDGVATFNDVCLESDGSQAVGGPIFNPDFPATCPYVTAVGATQVVSGKSVWESESACEDVIYSGGGFSNVFAIPDWQKSAVDHYLTEYPPPYPTNIWNATGSRAYPDLAANGANYVIAVQGEFFLVYGTSAASPVVGSILTSVNDARLAVGKSSIGFINPVIYTPSFMAAFHDITNGTNPGCGTVGFYSQPGWDPVAGVGTPNFAALLGEWLALP
ncbi:Aorsin [Sparassis crispa]|uniref:Aorsin n=1 Tax=Sparassis crispa TaxID=139825 RepID=A0A401GT32_9APHY|nr:Aorsin [Sparassis crispa]GBE84894.1 Aorsin [Sparassis crispa]